MMGFEMGSETRPKRILLLMLPVLMVGMMMFAFAEHHLCMTMLGPTLPAVGLVFQTLGSDAPVGPGPSRPLVYVASSATALSSFVHFLNAKHQQVVTSVDFSSYIVLAVFAGSKASSGHTITVQQVSMEDGRLRVLVAVRTPAPTDYVRPAFTSPYHVVQVPRSAMDNLIPSSWVLVDGQSQILAVGSRDQR